MMMQHEEDRLVESSEALILLSFKSSEMARSIEEAFQNRSDMQDIVQSVRMVDCLEPDFINLDFVFATTQKQAHSRILSKVLFVICLVLLALSHYILLSPSFSPLLHLCILAASTITINLVINAMPLRFTDASLQKIQAHKFYLKVLFNLFNLSLVDVVLVLAEYNSSQAVWKLRACLLNGHAVAVLMAVVYLIKSLNCTKENKMKLLRNDEILGSLKRDQFHLTGYVSSFVLLLILPMV